MIRLNIHEAKTHLSAFLGRLQKGEVIILCKRNKPIAEIRALPAERKTPRPIGLDKGKFTIPPEFYAPLPDEILNHFRSK